MKGRDGKENFRLRGDTWKENLEEIKTVNLFKKITSVR